MTTPAIDQAALRARFNPDGSLLRRQQMRMLDILIEVDRICRKHNIRYWLSSGTLIGAVRHKGFIPWDDDLDIEMLLPDYKRLMKVLPEELPENFALQ
ncbi:MAG: LicD family protein, partial [Prevotella sp.]|nr:LicD family protein [Prevotella sp.]